MVSLRQRDRVLDLLRAGADLREVAKRTRVPGRIVKKIAAAADLLRPEPPKKTKQPKATKPEKETTFGRVAPWQHALALSLLKSGVPCSAVADEVGIADTTAARISRMYYLPVRPRGRQKGEAGVRLPIRAAVLDLVRKGATLKAADETVGISRQAVWLWAREAGVVIGRKRIPKRADPAGGAGKVENAPEFA